MHGRGPERGGIVPVPDRVVALLPYLVPLLDGLRYSRFFFAQFPQAIFLLQPLQPLASVYFRIPFAGMISFFAIYMGIAENRNLSRFVRFNGMQAIILDVCLVLPGMVEYVLSPRERGAALELASCATTSCGCSCWRRSASQPWGASRGRCTSSPSSGAHIRGRDNLSAYHPSQA